MGFLKDLAIFYIKNIYIYIYVAPPSKYIFKIIFYHFSRSTLSHWSTLRVSYQEKKKKRSFHILYLNNLIYGDCSKNHIRRYFGNNFIQLSNIKFYPSF